ncbi:MAG: hypothetical protein AAGF24_11105 [Cyanobacteria bacterium P01_H01_bin.121]
MKYDFEFIRMPLAVYREVAAHLMLVEGVAVKLHPQTSTQFEYLQSQIGGLSISSSGTAEQVDWSRVAQILTYYHDRYPLQDASTLTTLNTVAQTSNQEGEQAASPELTATAKSEVSA